MKRKEYLRRMLALVMVSGLTITGIPNIPAVADFTSETVKAAETYAISIETDKTTVVAGETVSFKADVIKEDGTKVTDLKEEGIQLYWWSDCWATGYENANMDATYSNYDENSGYSLTADVTFPTAGTYHILQHQLGMLSSI